MPSTGVVSCQKSMMWRAILWVLVLWLITIPAPTWAANGARLTAADRRVLVETLCKKIEAIYPFPEIGERTSNGILQRHRAGDYDHLASPETFAARLTDDMESLSQDKHLDLLYDPTTAQELLARSGTGDAQAGPPPGEIEHARWESFGFRELKILDGNVAYLDLRVFFAARHAGATAANAMAFLSGANAVIIDLRRNGGGWDDMVTLLASYFVDREEAEVVAIAQSTIDGSYYASVLQAWVPGKKLLGIPVYVLISPTTASAAEAFASILRHARNDVLLVGQRSAGAENPVEMLALDRSFVLKIPCYKKLYFGTRSGWEGTGLAPDVEVAAEQALEVAHLHALRTLQARFPDDGIAREKLQWGVDGRRAVVEPAAVASDLLESYAGRYRGGTVRLDDHVLQLTFDDQSARRLYPVSDEYFVVQGRDDLRIRFVREGERVVAMERIYSDGYRALSMRE